MKCRVTGRFSLKLNQHNGKAAEISCKGPSKGTYKEVFFHIDTIVTFGSYIYEDSRLQVQYTRKSYPHSPTS